MAVRRRGIFLALLVGWIGVPSAVWAQTPEDVALDAVRTRSSILPDDPAIDNWITYQIETLRKDLGIVPKEAGTRFTQAFRAQNDHPENSDAFNTAFVRRIGARFAAEFDKGQALERAVGLTLARTLAQLNSLEAWPGLSAGLKANDQPAIRYTCARALAALIPSIEADANLTGSTIDLLRQVGAEEPNGVVLTGIYEALFFQGANFNAAVEAMLSIVKAQLRRREQDTPACDGAEEVAYNFLRGEVNNISSPAPLVAVLAAELRLDVERHATEGVSDQERYLIEITIDAAEALLVRLVGLSITPPSIREEMKKEDRDIKMPLELNKWIGTPQTRGILNDPPWNVPVGAPVPT